MKISAIGTANPKYCQEQNSLIDMMRSKLKLSELDYRFLKKTYQATGVEQRYTVIDAFNVEEETSGKNRNFFVDKEVPGTAERMAIYKAQALPLALQAIHDCIGNIPKFDLQAITHVIVVSCTGMYAPGLDIEIIEKLNLPTESHRTCINFMGCYGVFSGLKMAAAICKAEKQAKVLLVSVEICSIHLQQEVKHKENIVAAGLFGDGAAAAIVENSPKSRSYLCLNDFYCDLMPEGKKDMAWTVGNFGFEINLGSYVPKLIQKGIHTFLQKALKQFAVSKEDIDYYAIHPGSQKILATCEKALAIPENSNQHAYMILKRFGNMSSATILYVLKNLWQDLNEKKQVANIFSCGFGPGLTIESMFLTYHWEA